MKVWRLGTKPDCMVVAGREFEESRRLHNEIIPIENYVPMAFEIITRKGSKKDVVKFFSGAPAIKGNMMYLMRAESDTYQR